MERNPDQKQQGDVTFEKVNSLPKRAKRKFSNIIREGEVTGHHHAIADPEDAIIYVFSDPNNDIEELFIEVKKEFATITHQEHGEITLEKGIHKIGAIREVDWFTRSVRDVRD